jgi:hypothetical protein
MSTRGYFQGINPPGSDACNSSPFSAEAQNSESITNSHYGAEQYSRGHQLGSHSIVSQNFMEPLLQELFTCPYPEPDQSTPPQTIAPRSVLILSTHLRLGLPRGLFPSGFLTNNLHAFLFRPISCYLPNPSHPPRLDHSNYTWRRAQLTKLLTV